MPAFGGAKRNIRQKKAEGDLVDKAAILSDGGADCEISLAFRRDSFFQYRVSSRLNIGLVPRCRNMDHMARAR